MQTPLPSKTFQRKQKYRPTKYEVNYAYDALNTHIFNSQLIKPPINIRTMNIWGLCIGYFEPFHRSKIKLSNSMICYQWMVTILAHEMCHQWQWDIHGPARILQNKNALLSHGPTFYEFKHKLLEYGIPLKHVYDHDKWFKHQDLLRI